jgi:UDP-N-acetylmuramoyl-tripeptide--D-alanyl-D-alanine ligase
MLELGESSEADHRLVGAYAAEQGVDVLLAVGAEAAAIAAGAGSVPQWQGTAVTPVGRDDALAWVRNNVAGAAASGGSWVVLVKASRGAALETVAEGLLDEEEGSR